MRVIIEKLKLKISFKSIGRRMAMTGRSGYRTRQKEELLAYLVSRQGEHVTAAGIHDDFRSRGETIGMATIYRHLEKLVEEGLVRKFTIGATGGACFEYVGEEACGADDCFHCKCEICGRLIHLRCEELSDIRGHIRASHGFVLDPMRTVFYGVCDGCRVKIHV